MELINKTLLNYLFNYPEMCIYGLINSKDHKIYLGYTANLPLALSRIVKETKYSNNKLKKDWDKLEFSIIETVVDKNNLRLRYKFHQTQYSNNGWTLYKTDSKLPSYKLRIEVIDNGAFRDLKVAVKLITRGYKELIVGVFENFELAKTWMRDNYPNSEITNIVYAKNKLTEEYLDPWKS